MADDLPASTDLAALIAAARARTSARVLVGRAGASYRTETQLALRADHAAALDAVHAEVDLARDLGLDFVRTWALGEVSTQATSKAEYLLRPDLGRRFHPTAAAFLQGCPVGADVQLVVGDGLSAAAVAAQVPDLLPRLVAGANRLGWSCGRPFFVHRCRVGIINEVGAILRPSVVILLIGERPGLATAESLSAYLGYRPRPGQTDADRNLISNIHARGTPPVEAAERILQLAARMIANQISGVALKEVAAGLPPSLPDREA